MYSKFRKLPKWTITFTAAALLVGTVGSSGAWASAAASFSTPIMAVSAITAPKAEVNQPLRIVGVGDSLTLGYELGMSESSVPYGYVDRLYEQALYHGRAELVNYGILGLKSPGLQKLLEAAAAGTRITADQLQPNLSTYPLAEATVAKSAQLGEDLKKANLIVLTIGGNDFTPIFNDILNDEEISASALQTRLDALLASYYPSLEASLRTILKLNPKATVVFADQYLPAPKPSTINQTITQEQYAVLTDGVAKLKTQTEAIAAKLTKEGFDVRTVDVSTPFRGKELSYTSILRGDIHPKQSGYDVMGRVFAQGIWGDYRDPEALDAGTPLRVVVNGKALKSDNKPVLKNNTTFLPMRDVTKALNATLVWDGPSRTATIKSGDKVVAFTIGADTMKVNGQTVPLETPAYLQQSGGSSVTYLPLAALSKGLGYQVVYRKPIATVFIQS
ncbi:stalk domain-containing protein [Paenibacillus sp. CF384]|uniref:stalk domain-containing protein n=1 Tax=Paenibacillus sp. CF384 TaxID=1884382 RepID=UPI00089CBCD3|nr:stalk domain-containing protein [Paenibacillus sp. CF384]SDX65419.1 Copper amine oxidase N-terminal domain-containing protein [Paenibacillus sp. CF384]